MDGRSEVGRDPALDNAAADAAAIDTAHQDHATLVDATDWPAMRWDRLAVWSPAGHAFQSHAWGELKRPLPVPPPGADPPRGLGRRRARRPGWAPRAGPEAPGSDPHDRSGVAPRWTARRRAFTSRFQARRAPRAGLAHRDARAPARR